MKQPTWILKETAVALHERLLLQFGGDPGLRDEGLLESALARPINLLAYSTPNIFDLAAAYGFGIVKNHPFIDGNKRVGFAIAVLFIETNGFRFHAGQADATTQVLALTQSTLDEAGFSAWLGANSSGIE